MGKVKEKTDASVAADANGIIGAAKEAGRRACDAAPINVAPGRSVAFEYAGKMYSIRYGVYRVVITRGSDNREVIVREM